MYNCKETTYSLDELGQFIVSMIDEYEYRLSQLIEQKKNYINDISEKKNLIDKLNKKNNISSNIFSPNSKEINIKEYHDQLENIKDNMDLIEKEQSKLECIILHLKEIEKTLSDQDSPSFNIGLNILELQEQDRQRIGMDLHDSTVQNLTSLIHKSELCSRLVDMDPVRTKLELNAMSNTLKAVINEIREIIYNLKPMSLDDLGLLTTVERYINQLMTNHDIEIKLTHNDEKEDILPVIKLSIFRMIQEACNNAIKHAEAKRIDIDITYQKDNISFSIKDDGKGFDAEHKPEYLTDDYSGYGLSIMKERVYLLSGTMKIQSTINKGTNVTITVPITKSEGEEK